MGLNALDMSAVHLFVRCTNLDMGSVVPDGVQPFCTCRNLILTTSSTTTFFNSGLQTDREDGRDNLLSHHCVKTWFECSQELVSKLEDSSVSSGDVRMWSVCCY